VDDIDELSNSFVDLINEGLLDEAEKRCQELREQYPETMDWMMRLAAVYEARKDWKRAADYYRQAADFAEENPGYDLEMIDDFRNTASRLEEKIAPGK
jgi:lipopolysaccharide biosynthesis regulator YciM